MHIVFLKIMTFSWMAIILHLGDTNQFLETVTIKLWLKLKCLCKINSLHPNEVNNHHFANLFLFFL